MSSLNSKTVTELRSLAKSKGYNGYTKLAKEDLIKFITNGGSFNSKNKKASVIKVEIVKSPKKEIIRDKNIYDKYTSDFLMLKHDKETSFTKLKQLGKPGKEGVVYLVTDGRYKYAMKTFRKTKSGQTLEKEAFYQHLASKKGISPKIIEYNTEHKYIIMELLDRTLMEVITDQEGLTNSQQEQILELYRRLDDVGIMLNDANPLNIMEKNGKFFSIDYGFSKFTNHKDFKDYSKPNFQLMPLGLILWLKDYCKYYKSFTIIRNAIPIDIQNKFKLKF